MREMEETLTSGCEEKIWKWYKEGVAVVVEAYGFGMGNIHVLLVLVEKSWLVMAGLGEEEWIGSKTNAVFVLVNKRYMFGRRKMQQLA